MKNPVTVDADDLEALILAAQGSVAAHQALEAVTRDPAYVRCRPAFFDATARVQSARAAAIRVKSPDESLPMTPAEYNWCKARLDSFRRPPVVQADEETGLDIVWMEGAPTEMGYVGNPLAPECEDLRKKRLIETAMLLTTVKWHPSARPENLALPQMVFRLSARGEAEYERIAREKRK